MARSRFHATSFYKKSKRILSSRLKAAKEDAAQTIHAIQEEAKSAIIAVRLDAARAFARGMGESPADVVEAADGMEAEDSEEEPEDFEEAPTSFCVCRWLRRSLAAIPLGFAVLAVSVIMAFFIGPNENVCSALTLASASVDRSYRPILDMPLQWCKTWREGEDITRRLLEQLQVSVPKLNESSMVAVDLATLSAEQETTLRKLLYNPKSMKWTEQTVTKYQRPLQELRAEMQSLEMKAMSYIESESDMLEKFTFRVTGAMSGGDKEELLEALTKTEVALMDMEAALTSMLNAHNLLTTRVSSLVNQAEQDSIDVHRRVIVDNQRYRMKIEELEGAWWRPEMRMLAAKELHEIAKEDLNSEASLLFEIQEGIGLILKVLRKRGMEYKAVIKTISAVLGVVGDKEALLQPSVRVLRLLVAEFCAMGYKLTEFHAGTKVAELRWTQLIERSTV